MGIPALRVGAGLKAHAMLQYELLNKLELLYNQPGHVMEAESVWMQMGIQN